MENYKIVCYSKESDWEQVIQEGLTEEEAKETIGELEMEGRISGSGHLEGYYISQ